MRDRKSDTRHRRVAEAKIGRNLAPSEVVHHVNEDKTDDSQANLSVAQRGAHTGDHNRHRSVSKLRKALRMVRDGSRLNVLLPLLWTLSVGDAGRLSIDYDDAVGRITCWVPQDDTNRYLNIGVRGYDIRTPLRKDQSTGHVLTGLPDDPSVFTYVIPSLLCEPEEEALAATCELFSKEGKPPVGTYRRAEAPIPWGAAPGPYQNPS